MPCDALLWKSRIELKSRILLGTCVTSERYLVRVLEVAFAIPIQYFMVLLSPPWECCDSSWKFARASYFTVFQLIERGSFTSSDVK
jgi:hypothetical protein